MYARFAQLLKENNMTCYRVSKETGIATATLSDWKNEKSIPKIEKLKILAKYFDVSIDWLLGESDVRQFSKNDELSTIMDEYYKLSNTQKENILEIIKGYNSSILTDEDTTFVLNYIASSSKVKSFFKKTYNIIVTTLLE